MLSSGAAETSVTRAAAQAPKATSTFPYGLAGTGTRRHPGGARSSTESPRGLRCQPTQALNRQPPGRGPGRTGLASFGTASVRRVHPAAAKTAPPRPPPGLTVAPAPGLVIQVEI